MAEGSGSDLRHSLLKARIAKLPHLPAIAPHAINSQLTEEDEDLEDEERDEVHDTFALPNIAAGRRKHRGINRNAYQPISAEDCFEEALEVDIGDVSENAVKAASTSSQEASNDQSSGRATFRVYYTPPKKRGDAGQNGLLSVAAPVVDIDEDDNASETVFVFFHGAGYGALSFALAAKSITQQSKGRAGVLAYDCRGHGRTVHPTPEQAKDLSLDSLTEDGLAILAKVFPEGAKQPLLVLVGHSMGGAVAVSIAHRLANRKDGIGGPRVAGVAVLDVVEGTAIAALPSMKTIVAALPQGFDSIEAAIQWHVDSGTIVNVESAQRSVPSLLKVNPDFDGKAAAESKPEEAMEVMQGSVTSKSSFRYIWRHDLLATEPYWHGWFTGLSKAFLAVKCARLLVLAGADRLDTDLMIGQMQGKYQLVVFQDVGHNVQEDAPTRTAHTLIDFWQRNERIDVKAVKGLRKVGE